MKPLEDSIVRGEWRCAKCGFRLSQRTLHAYSGDVSVRDDLGEKCPNDGSTLFRMWQSELDAETA